MAGGQGSPTERMNLLNNAGHAPKLAVAATTLVADGSTLSWDGAAHAFQLQQGGGGPAAANTVTDGTTYGIVPAVGLDTTYARAGHRHGTPAAPTAASVGALGAQAAAGGDLGGNYPNPTVAQARGLRETAGPTTLTLGAVADGELLKRVGNTIIGVTLSFTLAFSGDPQMEPSGQHLSAGRST